MQKTEKQDYTALSYVSLPGQLYMFYGKILAHLESVAAPCPFPIASLAAGLDSPACLLLPLLGSAAAAAAAAVADRQVHWTM